WTSSALQILLCRVRVRPWSQEGRPALTPSAIHPVCFLGHESAAVSSPSIAPLAAVRIRTSRGALLSSSPCSGANQASPERHRLLHRRRAKSRPDRAHCVRRQG